MDQRSILRRAISILLGAVLALAGATAFSYMMIAVNEPVKIFIWLIPITVFAAGIAILWDDFRQK